MGTVFLKQSGRIIDASCFEPSLQQFAYCVHYKVEYCMYQVEEAGYQSLCNNSGSLELVGHNTINRSFKEAEQREPYPRPYRVPLHESLIISQCVVVKKQPGRNVEGNEDIDGIMLVARQDEKDAKHVEKPREDMK